MGHDAGHLGDQGNEGDVSPSVAPSGPPGTHKPQQRPAWLPPSDSYTHQKERPPADPETVPCKGDGGDATATHTGAHCRSAGQAHLADEGERAQVCTTATQE